MILDLITSELLMIVFFIIVFISILVSLLYYLRVHDKNIAEYLGNFIRYYDKMAIKNTFDHRRKTYKKINNICIIVFWFSFLMICIIKLNK